MKNCGVKKKKAQDLSSDTEILKETEEQKRKRKRKGIGLKRKRTNSKVFSLFPQHLGVHY